MLKMTTNNKTVEEKKPDLKIDTVELRTKKITNIMRKIESFNIMLMKKPYLDWIMHVPMGMEYLDSVCNSLNCYNIYNIGHIAEEIFPEESFAIQASVDFLDTYAIPDDNSAFCVTDDTIKAAAQASWTAYNGVSSVSTSVLDYKSSSSSPNIDSYFESPISVTPIPQRFPLVVKPLTNKLCLRDVDEEFSQELFKKVFDEDIDINVIDVIGDGDCGFSCWCLYLEDTQPLQPNRTPHELRNILKRLPDNHKGRSTSEIQSCKKRQKLHKSHVDAWMNGTDLSILCDHFKRVAYVYEKKADEKDSFTIVDPKDLAEKEGYNKAESLFLLNLGGMHFQYIKNPFASYSEPKKDEKVKELQIPVPVAASLPRIGDLIMFGTKDFEAGGCMHGVIEEFDYETLKYQFISVNLNQIVPQIIDGIIVLPDGKNGMGIGKRIQADWNKTPCMIVPSAVMGNKVQDNDIIKYITNAILYGRIMSI